MRRLALGAVLAATAFSPPALARSVPPLVQATPPVPPGAGDWADQINGIAARMQPADDACTARCFTLERLSLKGSAAKGTLRFVLEGEVLARHPVAVPLFGPPGKVSVDGVTAAGRRVAVGFEGDHYFANLAPGRFVLEGSLMLGDDRALAIAGPLNVLQAELEDGRLAEGSRLSGLSATTLHFDSEATARAPDPTVFQLSRAVRIGQQTTFEYKLGLRSGTDLGVVRLPLRFRERVVDVTGVTGWRVEGEELVLPVAGKSADVVITGTLGSLASFSPDPRSTSEWWLVESDVEHRVAVSGDAKQVDASSSPIARTQPSSHLFLVQRGEHLDVAVMALAGVDVLAATVRSQSRLLVFGARGEVVAHDTFRYENNGVDDVPLVADGQPIYLGTDGRSQRLLSREGSSELALPLEIGAHTMEMQTVREQPLGTFGGWTSLEAPTLPLSTTSATFTVAVPPEIHPAFVLGGDRPWFGLGWGDAAAVGLSALASLALLRGTRRRLLGTVAASGLWFAWAPGFVVGAGAAALFGAGWALRHVWAGRRRSVLVGALALGGATAVVAGLSTTNRSAEAPAVVAQSVAVDQTKSPAGLLAAKDDGDAPAAAAPLVAAGMVHGIRPVALGLPSYARSVTVGRDLVLRGHPFRISFFYLTDASLWLLFGLWAAATTGLAWLHRAELAALRKRLQERLAPDPAAPEAPAPAPVAAPEPAPAE
jgi:hypothetical protein